MSEMREVYDTAYMIIKQLIREVEQVTERLTEKTDKGIWVKESHGENVIKTLYQCYGTEPLPDYSNCDEGYLAMEKLEEYETAEEDGRMVVLPCKVWDKVYQLFIVDMIDKKPIYKVFQSRVNKIIIDYFRTIFLLETLDENKYKSELTKESFGETVFLTYEEAEKALKEIKHEI